MIVDKNVASTIATFQLEQIIEISFKLAMTTAGENFDRIHRYGTATYEYLWNCEKISDTIERYTI